MYNILWGCPFLSLLFLFAVGLSLTGEHRLLRRQQVRGQTYRRLMLIGLWLLLVPVFAMLWLVSTSNGHGAVRFVSVQGLFLIFVIVHNAVLKPIYTRYKRVTLDQSACTVWGR